ncbi:MAG: hypothetical protein ACTSQJ_00345 [Promethearchaeota archaeon]
MILIVSPIYDIPTSIGTVAASELVNFCKKNNIPHKLLFGLQALRPIFELTTMFNDIDAIFYYGHGVSDALLGQHIFFKMLDISNAGLLKDKIIYAMACHSGNKLAPKAIEKGAFSYYGHNTWYYGAFPNEEHDYLTDWVNYVTKIPKELLNGKTTFEALYLYKETIDKYLNEYKNNKYLDWDWYFNSAKSNKDYLKLYGNTNMRLKVERK